jgi:hypothetical protein
MTSGSSQVERIVRSGRASSRRTYHAPACTRASYASPSATATRSGRTTYVSLLAGLVDTAHQLRLVVAGSTESFEARAKFSCFRLPKLTFQLCGSLGQPLYL